jgi:DNA polymerase I-like protein with 3'-5' exonuclease and polymerase domains
MSCSDPNLQQQPARDPEIGPRWRGIYVPDEGGWWACLDFSQQEPRWLTHYAALEGCTGAENARTRYIEDPTMDSHQFMADLTGLPRKEAKAILLGRMYGMGGAKFCRKLGLPTKWVPSRHQGKMIEVAGDEGQALLDTFDLKAPYVREIAWRAQAAAERRGYIKLLDGRRCRFPARPTGGWDWTYKSLNRLIQGSSAVQMKKAMVDADAAGFRLQLQVHDEIDLTIWNRAEAVQLERIMLDAVECTVPHKVDIEVGPSWGSIEKI